MNKTLLIPMLFEHGVVRINTHEGFLLTSGLRAPVYLDHRRLFGIPKLREAALDVWTQLLLSTVETLKRAPRAAAPACVGTATAGIAPAFGLASRLELPFGYVRSSPKAHGLGQSVEGAPVEGTAVFVVDDMVTTGGSLVQACNTLLKTNCSVMFATSFTSKHKRNSLTLDAASNVQTHFLHVFSLRELLEAGKTLGCIASDEWQPVAQWANDSGI